MKEKRGEYLMKKRALTLLTGLVALGTASFAFDGSIQHEFRLEDSNRADGKNIEWTLAKGNVSFTDRIRFDFDVDKDIYLKSNDHKDLEGWDTAFGINVKGFVFDAFGYTWQNENYFGFEWDAKESRTDSNGNSQSADMVTSKERYYFSPRINAQVTDWTWFQIDPRFTVENAPGKKDEYMDLRFQAATDWGNGWENWLEIYNYIGGDDRFNDDNYSLDVENYLTYTKQLGNTNFYSWTEFGLEAYNMANNSKDDDGNDVTLVSVYADPQLQYRATIGSIDVTPYVGYTMYEGDDNFQQFETGIKFKSKF